MTPEDALKELQILIPDGTPLEVAIERFINFYGSIDIEGCNKDDDGDMLLFQWGGPYTWDESFSINLTRQFSYDDENGEYEGMQQLQMNCKYDPSLININDGNMWFGGDDVNEFCKTALSSPCVKLAIVLPMKSLEFELGDV